MVTRFAMIHSVSGQVESGANYPGCSQSNPNACQPKTFASIDDAQSYCTQNNESLFVVGAAIPDTPDWNNMTAKVWSYVSHPDTLPPPPPVVTKASLMGDNTMLYVGIAAVAYFLFMRK